jgi:hypothetical protein
MKDRDRKRAIRRGPLPSLHALKQLSDGAFIPSAHTVTTHAGPRPSSHINVRQRQERHFGLLCRNTAPFNLRLKIK